MSPYEVKLLIEIDVGLYPLTAKKTPLLGDTLGNFAHRGFIEVSIDFADKPIIWKITKLGRAVCNRFYNVNADGIKFCGECGQDRGDTNTCEGFVFVEVCGECGRILPSE